MTDTIELPKELIERVRHYAIAAGTTPAKWLDQVVPPLPVPPAAEAEGEPKRTLRDRMKGLIGGFHGPRLEDLPDDPNDPFGNYLLQKKREGRL